MKRIITAIIALMLSITSVCALASCKNENQPSTGWEVQRILENGEADESGKTADETLHKLGFTVGDGTKRVAEIWVNIPKMYENEAELSVDVYSSTSDSLVKRSASPTFNTFTRKITKDEVKQAKDLNYWIKLDFNDAWKDKATDKNASYAKYVMISVKGVFEFNEIAFVDQDGKLLSVNLSKINYWYQPENVNYMRNVVKTTEIPDMEKNPWKLIDEQSKFALRDKK
ncbi:MAG: hypothetical protein PUI31_04525 [Clostridia bacterium]|nr:hypothetical protein [Clostridia bacterium]MDY2901640.1 hypothetical protein [Christensenellaceae bacterium]